jgi:hypothetical protein
MRSWMRCRLTSGSSRSPRPTSESPGSPRPAERRYSRRNAAAFTAIAASELTLLPMHEVPTGAAAVIGHRASNGSSSGSTWLGEQIAQRCPLTPHPDRPPAQNKWHHVLSWARYVDPPTARSGARCTHGGCNSPPGERRHVTRTRVSTWPAVAMIPKGARPHRVRCPRSSVHQAAGPHPARRARPRRRMRSRPDSCW